MKYLNPLEQEILECLLQTREYFGAGRTPVKRYTFYQIMSHLRDMIKKLENKQFGCSTGTHTGNCNCLGDEIGLSRDDNYHRKRHAQMP